MTAGHLIEVLGHVGADTPVQMACALEQYDIESAQVEFVGGPGKLDGTGTTIVLTKTVILQAKE